MEPVSSSAPLTTLVGSMNQSTSESAREVLPDLFLFLLAQVPPLAMKSLRLISSIAWLIYKPISVLAFWLARLLYTPLRPFVVLARSLFGIFVQAPYNTIVRVLSTLYPLFALCGVAFVFSGILGLGGRLLCSFIISSLVPPKATQPPRDARQPYYDNSRTNAPTVCCFWFHHLNYHF
jgi:hypothetical protein